MAKRVRRVSIDVRATASNRCSDHLAHSTLVCTSHAKESLGILLKSSTGSGREGSRRTRPIKRWILNPGSEEFERKKRKHPSDAKRSRPSPETTARTPLSHQRPTKDRVWIAVHAVHASGSGSDGTGSHRTMRRRRRRRWTRTWTCPTWTCTTAVGRGEEGCRPLRPSCALVERCREKGCRDTHLHVSNVVGWHPDDARRHGRGSTAPASPRSLPPSRGSPLDGSERIPHARESLAWTTTNDCSSCAIGLAFPAWTFGSPPFVPPTHVFPFVPSTRSIARRGSQ